MDLKSNSTTDAATDTIACLRSSVPSTTSTTTATSQLSLYSTKEEKNERRQLGR